MLHPLRRGFERLLEAVVVLLLGLLAALVIAGVAWRTAGSPIVWYDEVASVVLAWLTYYGAALAALKRAHIGFPGLVDAMPARYRVPVVLATEALVIGFFLLLAWVGWRVLEVLQGEALVSLPSVPIALTQSVIPVGAALYVIAELLSLPAALAGKHGPEL